MEQKIKELIKELRGKGVSPFQFPPSLEDPEAKVNVWFVIAKAEDAILSDPKNHNMGASLRTLIEDLKKPKYPSSGADPETKVNVWFVIARLNEILLEGKKG